MALINIDKGYTKTGGNFFTRLSNSMTYVPIPLVNSALVTFFGFIGTALDAGGWLVRGKVASAATAVATGAAGVMTNNAIAIGGITNPIWWANLGSGIATGRSLGTHVRKVSEVAVGGVTGAVGLKPQVLRAYPAGIGSIGNGAMQAGPGRFVSDVARSRGEDPNAAYARLNSNQSEHLAALESAQSQGGYRGM